MVARFDVIVLGVGTMGSATLDALTRRGASALGIEQFEVGHERGSAGGDTRLIRKAYFEHPDYVPLLLRAYEGWADLERRTGQRVLFPTGAVYLGPEVIGGSREAAEAHGLAHDVLTGAEVSTRWPAFALAPDAVAMVEPDAGYVLATPSIRLFAAEARRRGAEMLEQTVAEAWETDGAGVTVCTTTGTYTGAHLVVTAGPWAPSLLGDLDVSLRVTRQALFWFEPAAPELFERGRFPCWAADAGEAGGIFYGFPLSERGVKVAHHHPGPTVAPDDDRPPTDAELSPVRDVVNRLLPAATGPVIHATTCRYTMSPDEHFVIGPHPHHDRVTIACGFSGHGFKFAPVVGEALADLALDGGTDLPIGFLAPARLG